MGKIVRLKKQKKPAETGRLAELTADQGVVVMFTGVRYSRNPEAGGTLSKPGGRRRNG